MLLARFHNIMAGSGVGLISRTLPWPELVDQALAVHGGFCNALWQARGTASLEFMAETRFPNLLASQEGKMHKTSEGAPVQVMWPTNDASMLLQVDDACVALAPSPWCDSSIAMPEAWYGRRGCSEAAEVVPCQAMHQQIRELAQLAALLAHLTGHEWEYLRIRH